MKQKIYIAALFAGMLALVGCGGGSSTQGQQPPGGNPPGNGPTPEEIAAVKSACDANDELEYVAPTNANPLGGCGIDNSESEAKEKLDMAKALNAAIANRTAFADANNPLVTANNFKASGSELTLGSWKGQHYTKTVSGKVTEEARVYTNQGEATSTPFAEAVGFPAIVTADGPTKGYIPVANDGTNRARVMSSAFLHSGDKDHKTPDKGDAFYARGTYGGAPGEYRCTGDDCSSTNDGEGSPSELGGTWHFKPDAGAMVSQSDEDYLYFGWWIIKDGDGKVTNTKAFKLVQGTPPTAISDAPGGGAADEGSATYTGKAAGKYSWHDVANPSTSHGGHFTADAELTAKFGATRTITGTIDEFRLNDGSSDPGWSVAFHTDDVSATFDGAGVITNGDLNGSSAANAPGTIWSVNGNAADASGAWSGQMYDEKQGDADDGSNIPTTIIGDFTSHYGIRGSMTGAFGATN